MGLSKKLHHALFLLLLVPAVATGQESVEALTSKLGQPEGIKARDDLVAHGESVIPALIKVLENPDANSDARNSAAIALGQIGGPQVIEPLRALVHDPSVGWAAIHALGEVGEPAKAAVADLAKVASADVDPKSSEGFVAGQAIEAIGKIGHGCPRAIEALTLCMTRRRHHEAALALTQLGAPGAEALVTLAAKYADDERHESKKRYGEVYLVAAWGRPTLDPEMIPVFERYMKSGKKHAYIGGLALASVGLPAKPVLFRLLEHDDPNVRAVAARGLLSMNFFAKSARSFSNEDVKDPVSVDEVFPKLQRLYRDEGGTVDWRIIDVMQGFDMKRTLAIPDVRKAYEERAKKAEVKYTVWVFQRVNGRWVKDESRIYEGNEKTAREYLNSMKAYPDWTSTSNLPQTDPQK